MVVMTLSGSGGTDFCLSSGGLTPTGQVARMHTIDMAHRAGGKAYGLITGLGDGDFDGDLSLWRTLLKAIVKEARSRGLYKLIAVLKTPVPDFSMRQDAYWEAGFDAHGRAFRLDLASEGSAPCMVSDSQKRWLRMITRDDGSQLTVGSASLVTVVDDRSPRPFALLEDLVIEPAWRGQGHAKALVSELIVRARDAGCRDFRACTRFKNTTAQKLYASLGMTQIGLEFRINLS